MNADVYRLGRQSQRKRSRRKLWAAIFILMLALVAGGAWYAHNHLKSKTTITQSKPTVTHVSYAETTKHYSEPDFTIDLPASWQPLPRPAGPYQTYDWQLAAKGSADTFTIYEDTIPVNFAVNRVVVVEPQTDHMTVKGSASDNCNSYTTSAPSNAYHGGAPAKWQGVTFLCDQNNTERDVIGTSSTDGINTVLLKSQSTGRQHKFFFTYTARSINPDYTPFYAALASLNLK